MQCLDNEHYVKSEAIPLMDNTYPNPIIACAWGGHKMLCEITAYHTQISVDYPAGVTSQSQGPAGVSYPGAETETVMSPHTPPRIFTGVTLRLTDVENHPPGLQESSPSLDFGKVVGA